MKIKKIIKYIFTICIVILIIGLSYIAIFIHISLKDIKNIELSLSQSNISSVIINTTLEEKILSNNCNNVAKIDKLNDYTINAFLSIEDKNFYNHKGINIPRILKSSIVNVFSGKLKQGASTITQQLVKNKYLSNEKTFSRKIKEIYLALKLEKKYSKKQILENYLNTIYYGHGAYGIENASNRFFDKSASELNLIESVCLASVINAPNYYSPFNNPQNLIQRQNLVLKEMLEDGYIDALEYSNNLNKQVNLKESKIELNEISLYDEYVLGQASKILNKNINDIINSGYKIYTYQDEFIQQSLDTEMLNDNNYQKNKYGNIADSLSIIIDNKSYGVSAISGRSQYDLVNIKRQPGSLIKPIVVFGPAFEEGLISPHTQILDEKINYDGYSPKNVDNKNYGYISVQNIVAKSLNIPTVKIAEKLSIDKCKKYGKECGIKFNKKDNGYALVLGGLTEGVTLKEITDAYSVFSNNGIYQDSSFIREIKTKDNVTIYIDNKSGNRVYNTDTAYLMSETLRYATKYGTSKKLSKHNFDIASKTGTVAYSTTNKNTDSYSLAYTTNHTMSVWLGNYSMSKEYMLEGSNNGGTFCTQIISNVFDKIYKENQPKNFVKPETVIECLIDKKVLLYGHWFNSSPPAILICSFTISIPVTISVIFQNRSL